MLKTILTLTVIGLAVKVLKINKNQLNTREMIYTSEGFDLKPRQNYPIHLNVDSLLDLSEKISLLKN